MDDVLLFLVGGIFGFMFECSINILFKKKCECNYSFGMPFLFIYGIGLIIIKYTHLKLINGYNIILRYLIYCIILTLFEFSVALFNKYIRHKDTWKYSNGMQISLSTTLVWGLLALFAEQLIK